MRFLSSVCAGLASLALVTHVCAQPEAQQELLPDPDFLYTTIDMPRGEQRALVRAALSGGYRIGPDEGWLTQTDLDVLLGATEGQTSMVKHRSQLSLIGDIQPGDPDTPWVGTIFGRHRLLMRHGVGGFRADEPERFKNKAMGADLVLDASADHGRVSEGISRFDVGARWFGALDARAGVWLRRALWGKQAMVMPLRFSYGATVAEPTNDGGEALWSRRVGADTGFGIKHYFIHNYHGVVEPLGFAWDRFFPALGPSVDRFELRGLHLDDIVFRDDVFVNDTDLLWLWRTWIGGHWLTAQNGTRDAAQLVFDVVIGARFPIELSHAEVTIGGGREAAVSHAAGRFVDRYRLEARAALVMRDHGIGGDTKFVSAWQRDIEADGPFQNQVAASASVWFDLCKCLSFGLYERSIRGLPRDADAFVLDQAWRHDVGLFLRIRGGDRGGDRYKDGPAGFSPF